MFTAIDLTSKGVYAAYAISDGQMVGLGVVSDSYHAMLWSGAAASVVDLHPRSGFFNGANGSRALGISAGQQVGWAFTVDLRHHALLWKDSAASVVDLHPNGFTYSAARGVSEGQQVGSAHRMSTKGDFEHALLWRGTPASVVDLTPGGFGQSGANGISGGQIVGWGSGPATGGDGHALLWRGSAASVVDFHPIGFTFSEANGTNGEEQVGWGWGEAQAATPCCGAAPQPAWWTCMLFFLPALRNPRL